MKQLENMTISELIELLKAVTEEIEIGAMELKM